MNMFISLFFRYKYLKIFGNFLFSSSTINSLLVSLVLFLPLLIHPRSPIETLTHTQDDYINPSLGCGLEGGRGGEGVTQRWFV